MREGGEVEISRRGCGYVCPSHYQALLRRGQGGAPNKKRPRSDRKEDGASGAAHGVGTVGGAGGAGGASGVGAAGGAGGARGVEHGAVPAVGDTNNSPLVVRTLRTRSQRSGARGGRRAVQSTTVQRLNGSAVKRRTKRRSNSREQSGLLHEAGETLLLLLPVVLSRGLPRPISTGRTSGSRAPHWLRSPRPKKLPRPLPRLLREVCRFGGRGGRSLDVTDASSWGINKTALSVRRRV